MPPASARPNEPEGEAMERKHKGAASELTACAWLLREGYEVFRNVSPFGRADLIAVKSSGTFYIDVKTDGKGAYKNVCPPLGIDYLLVTPDGNCTIVKSPLRLVPASSA